MIKKRNEQKNLARLLKKPGIIVDRTPQSDQYFNITFLPTELVAGKNVLKIQGSRNLVKSTEIQFEIIDANGNPIFYEVLNYLAADGSRAIVLYIYPETAPGRATLYLAGRAETNATTGRRLPVSEDPLSEDYIQNANVVWFGNIIVNPAKENTSEIIYLATPKVTIREIIQSYKTSSPTNSTRIATKSGSANQMYAQPTNLLPPANIGLDSSTKYTPPTSLNIVKEGQFKPVDVKSATGAITLTTDSELSDNRSIGVSGDVIRLDNKELLPRLNTVKSFFEKDMVGGTLVVKNINTASLVPKGAVDLGQLIDNVYVKSNVYTTTIVDVVNDTTAIVSDPFRYYYKTQLKQSSVRGDSIIGTVSGFDAATNFTASYLKRVSEVIETQSSQSYADITIANLEPASGDVYKVQTFYKPYGAFGNFTDAGFTILENTSILNDSSSLVSDVLLGQKEQPKGDFTSQAVINSYWQLTNVNLAGTALPTMSFTQDRLIDGLTITTGSGLIVNDADPTSVKASATYVNLKTPIPTNADTVYKLNFKAYGNNSSTYKTSQYPNAIIDIYISGSAVETAVDEIITDRRAKAKSRRLLGSKNLGTYLGSINNQGTYLNNSYEFKTITDGDITPLFVVRSGEWTLADVDVIAAKQSGFTPNYTNFKVRIPSVYLNTELVFNFKYFDSANNPAPVESTVAGVVFKGNNVYLAGNNNLLTGSVYIGNSLNSGIEMSGRSSGYVMSVGYKGFTSASLGKGPGGFLMWSGSNKLNVGVDNYQGVGLELVAANDDAHLIFDSYKNTFDVKAKSFFVGDSGSQFISGSNGQIEISSSNFHLTPNGDLFAQGVINANSGYFKNINVIGQPVTVNTALTTNDFFYTTQSLNYRRNKFIWTGVSPLDTGSTVNNNIVATASLYASSSIPYTLLTDAYRDFILSSSILYYGKSEFDDPRYYEYIIENPEPGLTIDTGSARNYYPRIGRVLNSPAIPEGTVTGSFSVGTGQKIFNLLSFNQLTWILMWANRPALRTVYNDEFALPGPELIDYLVTGSNAYTGLNTPVLKSSIIRARVYDPAETRYVDAPFFIDNTPSRNLIASSSISNITVMQGEMDAFTFVVQTELQYDFTYALKEPIFFDIQSIITGSSVNYSDIIGKRYTLGNINWTIGGPLYTSSLEVGVYKSGLAYYKNYTDIPDYNLPLQEFVRWNEKTDKFDEYSFTSSINVDGNNIAPYSGFLFISSSNAVVSSSQFTYGTNASNTSSADSVVFYNRKEYTPSGYGLTFTGTNYGTSSYGTQILGTAANVVTARGTIDINYLASSSTWDYIETDFIDISNYIQSSSLSAEAIKLQFAMRWTDNFTDNANITARGQVSSSGTLLPETTYNRYGGFPYGLQTYITVTFYDGEYKTTAADPRELQVIGTKIVASDSNGSTNKWYVGDFFINPYIQRTDGTIPKRIKMRISWGAHPSTLLQPASFTTYYTAGSSTGNFFFTGYPASGRYNGVVLSEIRLMQAAKAEVVDFTEVKIGGTSISTAVTGGTDYQEVNAAGLIPGDYRLAIDGTYNITLGTSWKPWTSLYSENIYRINEYSLSDRTRKTNIQNTDLGLNFINKLQPVSYTWLDSKDDIKHYGLIAQDVAEVLNNNKTGISVDGKTIGYTELIAPMVKAIQELSDKVKQLEREISSSK